MNKLDKKIESRFLKATELRKKSLKDSILRTSPEYIRIGVSRSCNFNCVSCWNYSSFLKDKRPKKWKSLKIKKEIVFNAIDQLKEMGGTGILFSGSGEPFTHPQMMNFIKKSKEKGLVVRIQTNLSLVKKISELAKCLNSGWDLVCVNLSAATDKTYSLVHHNQKKEKFYSILEKIRFLREKNVPVRYVYVVNKLNYKEIPTAIELSKKLGTKLHLEIMDYTPDQGLSRFALKKSQREEILKEVLKEKKYFRKENMENNLGAFANQLSYSALGLPNLKSCAIGYYYSIIDESGDVFYCYSKDRGFWLGNLNSESFEDIWQSEKYQDLRKRGLSGGFSRVCQNCIKKRGSNFKVRIYINPKLRNLSLERKLLEKKQGF